VLDIAERALALLDGEGLVSVRDGLITVVAVRDGRAGRAEGDDPARVAKAAALRARQARAWPVRGLPPPHVGESRTGEDIHEVIVTSWGTRTDEWRALDPPTPRGTGAVPAGPCVLAPAAVAVVLAALRPAFGVDLALGGAAPVAAPVVTLVDDARGRRAFDAEGVPRQRVVLIERGRFASGVRDASSPPTTGHATRPLTLAPRPDHLVLEPGDAELGPPDVAQLAPFRTDAARAVLARIEAVGPDGSVRLA
jgi:predicted Zn-dependent protease